MSHEENIAQQVELYGEPLGDLVRRTTSALGINQAQMARTLGLSPAMLSHLVTGQRVKSANPAAHARLRALVELAVAAPDLTASQLAAELESISALSADLTTTTRTPTPPAPGHEAVSAALRAVASGQELTAAAATLDSVAPGLAELLRTYTSGTPEQMREHFESTTSSR